MARAEHQNGNATVQEVLQHAIIRPPTPPSPPSPPGHPNARLEAPDQAVMDPQGKPSGPAASTSPAVDDAPPVDSGIGKSMSNDRLDRLMVALFVTLCLAVSVGRAGYALETVVVLALLVALAYARAPARTFPTAEAVSAGLDLRGKVAIVTGPTSGIGTETARVLALRGARVVLAGRSQAKLAATQAALEEDLAGRGLRAQFHSLVLDLDDLDSVRAFADAFKALALPLHILVNNAGVMALGERRSTRQGHERQVGINHLGHFLLTQLLTETLHASAPSQVICLTSAGFRLASHHFFNEENSAMETVPYDK